MTNWTVAKRIATGFASVILIAIALGAFAYARLVTISRQATRITAVTAPAASMCNDIKLNLKAQLNCVYQHIGSGDKKDMAHLEEISAGISAKSSGVYDEMSKLINTERGRELLEKTRTSRALYAKTRDEVLAVSRQATNNAEAYQLARTQLDPACESYTADMKALVDYCEAEEANALKTIQSAVQTSQMGILSGLAFAVVIGVAVAFLITYGTSKILRTVSSALDDGASQVASAANQVSASSQSLAEGSSEQAASLEETSSSLEEMSSMTKRNAENSQKANDLARQSRDSAEKGASDMKEMNSAMQAIKDSSDDIAKIIKTIDEIAFQTNILALNAAVEAARAGEAGMGFAVVADEVRNLAQRSAQAAKETSAKIEGAIAKSGQGVAISAKVAKALDDILSRARQVDELAAEVASASREQSQGINQVNLAVGQMDKVTQSNAANAEESAAAAEELNAQAESMKHSVKELMKLVGGQNAPETQRAPAPAQARKTAQPKSNGLMTRVQGNGRTHTVKSVPAPRAPELAAATSRGGADLPADDEFKDF
jgi:methyl-accepting chemotaxis protein